MYSHIHEKILNWRRETCHVEKFPCRHCKENKMRMQIKGSCRRIHKLILYLDENSHSYLDDFEIAGALERIKRFGRRNCCCWALRFTGTRAGVDEEMGETNTHDCHLAPRDRWPPVFFSFQYRTPLDFTKCLRRFSGIKLIGRGPSASNKSTRLHVVIFPYFLPLLI